MTQEMTWTTVSDGAAEEPEIKITFDTIGDEFVGTYLGMRLVEPSGILDKPYQQARFAGVGDNEGEIYFTNAGHSLRNGLKDVPKGSLVRLTYTDDIDTGQASPMKAFRVEVARKGAARVSRNT